MSQHGRCLFCQGNRLHKNRRRQPLWANLELGIMNMNIVYIHGFGSQVDARSDKYQELAIIRPGLTQVHGIAPDYTRGFQACRDDVIALMQNVDADLVVGTSMGGYMASHCAPELKRPFVAVNPPFKPSETLKKYLSMTEDYYGNTMSLSAETVAAYPDFNCDNTWGAAAFTLGDEVLDHTTLIEVMQAEGFQYWLYDGGDHRFSDFHQLTDSIKNHFHSQAPYV